VAIEKPNGLEDQNSVNNKLCNSIDKSKFIVFDSYPVPMRDQITLPVYIPSADVLSVELFDFRGEKTAIVLNENLQEGFHQISYNTSRLSKGLYILKFSFKNEMVIHKIMKN
jgi:hypothetical protein